MSFDPNILKLSINELNPFVLRALKNKPQTQYIGLCVETANQIISNERDANELGYNNIFQDKIREIIWDLIIERVVTIGTNSSNPAWPFLSLTRYGETVVNSTDPIPHDPAGYLSRLVEEIPSIDEVIFKYIEESIKTYNINALLSSTITLGCASEKALLLLVEAYKNAIQDENKRIRFTNETNGRMIKRQFEELSKRITNIDSTLPYEIRDGINTVLLGVFEMIRNNRNDAGHPTGKAIPREYVFANLQVFIPYCKKIYQLIEYFSNNAVV